MTVPTGYAGGILDPALELTAREFTDSTRRAAEVMESVDDGRPETAFAAGLARLAESTAARGWCPELSEIVATSAAVTLEWARATRARAQQ